MEEGTKIILTRPAKCQPSAVTGEASRDSDLKTTQTFANQ